MEWQNNKAHRLANLAALLRVGSGLSMWCFDAQGHLHFTTSSYEKELGAFWEIGGCREYALTEAKELDVPFVMSDAIGLIWVGEYAQLGSGIGRNLLLMGPLFHSQSSLDAIEDRMRQRDIPLELRSTGRQVLLHVPVIPIPSVNQYIRMLHFATHDSIILPQDCVYQTEGLNEPFLTDVEEKHYLDYQNSHAREQLIMQCVREGNMSYGEILSGEIMQASPDDYMTGDPLRESKNIMIIFTSQCCRAAIEGTLSVKTARELEVESIRKIEKCKTVTDLIILRQKILYEYISRVHACHTASGISQPILACCDYVKAHFMEPMELQDVAKAVGYTEYYLTRKFQKEMGIRLCEYIRKLRLEYAKIWLITTERSIQEISEQLQFGTRNYFSRVFKAQEGVTPMEYRERAKHITRN